MSNNPFRKKQVPQTVRDEINRRLGKNGLQWSAKRFPWIAVQSLSTGCTKPNYIRLNSGISANINGTKFGITSQPLYEQNYIHPQPVVNKLDIKKQGELGTTRKAVIGITAYTDEQLIELQKCYFIPGMSVRVEWGWSVDANADAAQIIPLHTLVTSENISNSEANKRMRKRTAMNPNYEGLQGIVANFKYSLTKENTWSCELEMIAEAEVFGNTKVNDVSCDKTTACREDEEGNEKCEKDSLLYTFFRGLYNNFGIAKATHYDTLRRLAAVDDREIYMEQFLFNAASRDESGQEDAAWTEDITPDFINQPDTTEAFINWACFEAAVNRFAIPQKANADDSSTYVFGRLNSAKVGITYHPAATSTDPRVCLLPDTIAQGKLDVNIAERVTGVDPPSCVGVDKETNRKVIVLDNILLNVVTLMKLLKEVERSGDGSLKTYVQNVLSAVNDACGSLWEFEIASTSDDDLPADSAKTADKLPTITVVETKSAFKPKAEDDITFYVPANPPPVGSCVREFKLELKMTEGMKTQALYSNGSRQDATAYTQDAKSQAGGSCGANALEGFRLYNTELIKNKAMSVTVDGKEKQCDDVAKPTEEDTPPTLTKLIVDLKDDVTDSAVSAVKTAITAEYPQSLKEKVNFNKVFDPIKHWIRDNATGASGEAPINHCDGMILPFDFGFTLDGIGGFSFGQMVSSFRIPEQLRKVYYWQVTSVEHSITPNDWTTTISTVCRYKPS